MLDMYDARQEYKAKEISNMCYVRSPRNLASRILKPEFQAQLYTLLTTAYHEEIDEEWRIRSSMKEKSNYQYTVQRQDAY